jgi:hypothetical protein
MSAQGQSLIRAVVAASLLASAAAHAQVVDRLFYNGFETRNAQVFSGVIQQSPYFGNLDSYGLPNGRSDAMATVSNTNLVLDRVCNAGTLYGQLSSSDATYTGTTLLFNLNGVDTQIGCNMSNALPTCADAVHKVSIGPGDVVRLKVTPHMPSRPISNVDSDIKVVVRFGWICQEL